MDTTHNSKQEYQDNSAGYSIFKAKYLAPTLLGIILVIAAFLRFYNLSWDNGIFAHPDERSTVAFYAPTIGWPEDSADLLDPRRSPLNPFWNVDRDERRSYTYGHFPLYTLVFLAHLINDLTPFIQALPFELPPAWNKFFVSVLSGQGYALIGRALVAISDLFSVYLLFLIGRRLYGLWGGLLAAAFSAVTVLQIQLAHFFAVDPITTTFTLLTIYGSMLLYEKRSIGAALLTGLGIGLAVAAKFSALPIVAVPVMAGYFATFHAYKAKSSKTVVASPTNIIGLIVLALAFSFLIFVVTSPFVLLDFENFKRAVIDEQGNMVSGLADFPFTRQYRNTTSYWYFIEQQLRWGMGWPLGLLGLVGTLWVVIKAIVGKAKVGEYLALVWLILYFGPTGLFLAKFMRYMVPVVPLVSLFGAGLIVAIWHLRKQQTSATPSEQWAHGEAASTEGLTPATYAKPTISSAQSDTQFTVLRSLAVATAAVVLVGTAIWAFAFVQGVYGSDHTWVTFSRWIYTNVPDGSCIAYEHWDDRMPTSLPEPDSYPEAHQFRQPQLPMYDDDTQQKYENIRDTLQDCDYVALATNRLWRTIPNLPERYPMSTRYYEALFSGELGFELVYTAETPPSLGPFVFDDQAADESFTVYDHPKPMLFKKVRQLSDAEWDALLGNLWPLARHGYVGPDTLLMRIRRASNDAPVPVSHQTLESEGKSLLLEQPVDQINSTDDFRWNSLANQSTLLAIIFWWVVAMVFGIITWPLTFLLFNKLPDRGYGLSKSLGLLLVVYFVWITSSLGPFGFLGNRLITVILGLTFLLGISLYLAMRHRTALLSFSRRRLWLIISAEAIFSLVYLYFVYLRILNPDLWQPWLGGEKMLEIGFLNAIVKSVQMPPYDPFYAGGIINYYYYGLFLVGVLIKLTGIQPSIAFNLAIPTLAGLTAINVFSLAGNLAATIARRYQMRPVIDAADEPDKVEDLPRLKVISTGLLGVLFVVFMGNLEGAAQFFRNLADVSLTNFNSAIPGLATLVQSASGFFEILDGQAVATYNYWDPTRVIPQTINEFPYFSFLFADLHPHMIGIPFTIMFLSLAYNWILPGTLSIRQLAAQDWSSTRDLVEALTPHFWRWLAIPFLLGALAVINTWDLPTYLGLMLATFLLNNYRQDKGIHSWKQALMYVGGAVFFTSMLLAATYLLYGPFFANYQALDVGLGLVHTQTDLAQHLKVWGFFLFIITSWLFLSLLHPHSRNSLLRVISLYLRRWNVWPHLAQIYRAVVKREGDLYQLGLWSLLLVASIIFALFILGYRVPAYLLPLGILALGLLFRHEVSAATAYLGLLAFTGVLVLFGVEFFFLRDFLGGGDYYRMNTLFKFFIQVWVMFSLVVAVTLPNIWDRSWNWPLLPQMVWRVAMLVLLLAGFIYPIFGTRTRVDDRFPGDQNRPPIGTLDGLAYMTAGQFEWPAGSPIQLSYDYEAIRWLQDNVEGTPIIAEAKIGYYREGGMRVAAYTGLPSILGGLHQGEQRYSSQIGRRDPLVNEFWTTPDPNRTQQLLDQLNISYVYVGQVERITYGDYIEDKFSQLHNQGTLELVFENAETKIYKRST